MQRMILSHQKTAIIYHIINIYTFMQHGIVFFCSILLKPTSEKTIPYTLTIIRRITNI